MTATAKVLPGPGYEVVVSRKINAPREHVFDAWVKSEKLAQWWGPNGFTNPRCEIDPRPGGKIYIEMRSADGKIFPLDGMVEEVVAPERIIFTARGFNPNNNKTTIEDRVTATFAEKDGQTLVTVHLYVLEVAPAFIAAAERMEIGWSQSLKRLEDSN
jgi:uncharacterized protein YndB with AHSA1/START domain